MKHVLIALAVCAASGTAAARDQGPTQNTVSTSAPRVYRLEELTWRQIEAFERQRTLFILPVGMIEQHGPHLPVGADSIAVMYEATEASTRVSRSLPDWNIVMMPAVNYGQSGANHLGDMPIHPGTYAIRQSTLRSLLADLGSHIAQNGFRWIFVINGHGAPTHNIAINEACDFVSESYGVTMLHLTGLFRADAAIQKAGEQITAQHFSASELSSFGLDVHAGVNETSGILAIRPDLVSPDYRTLPDQVGMSLEALRKVATAPGWQGYLSSPARATAAHGRAVEAWWIDGFTDLILRAVRGENMFVHPRVPETVPLAVASMLEKALANETSFGARLDTWLARRSSR